MARARAPVGENGTRLLDLWSPGECFGAPIGCVATTFTFDAGHFEEQCLARFLAMETDPAESARAYLIEREEKLSQVFACVLVDQRHAEATRSLRWHLLPIRLPGAAIQHAKLSLLVWERRIRLVIASANLTPAGYRMNREAVASFEFGPEEGSPTSLVRDALGFLSTLLTYAPGGDAGRGPRASLAAFLADTRRRLARWPEAVVTPGAPFCELIPVFPNAQRRSVPEHVRSIWRGPAATAVTVLSPFFDQQDSAADKTYEALASLLTVRGPRQLEFRTSGRRLRDGPIEIDVPKRLAHAPAKHRSTEHLYSYVDPCSTEDGDAHRPLHAKVLVVESDTFAVFVLGSSNCTVQGLGLIPGANVEVNVAYVLPASAGALREKCVAALPAGNAVPASASVLFTATADRSEGDTAALALLPAGFVEALFTPKATGGTLALRLDPGCLPTRFEVTDGSTHVLDAEAWNADFKRSAEIGVDLGRPVSGLTVRWLDDAGESRAAIWVVNVSDTALLPPPDELRNLSLEDLLAVLTSAEPVYRVLERLSARSSARAAAALVDPHQKVDTSQFLMRRMRRLAHALEGLRSRLQYPFATKEGLRWRLHGPLGPVALCRALQSEAGTGAAFFITEVAAALADVRRHSDSAVNHEVFTAAIAEVRAELRDLAVAEAARAPENLRDYVHAQIEAEQA